MSLLICIKWGKIRDKTETTLLFTKVFPTTIRSIGIGSCSAMARVGCMVTPFIAQVCCFLVSPFIVSFCCYMVTPFIAPFCCYTVIPFIALLCYYMVMPFVILLRCVCMCNAVYSSGMLLHGIAVYCSVILLHGNTIYCFILLLHGNATCCLDMLLCGYLHGNSYKHVHMHKHMLTCIQHTCMHSIACVRVCIQHACICTCMDAHWKNTLLLKGWNAWIHRCKQIHTYTYAHMVYRWWWWCLSGLARSFRAARTRSVWLRLLHLRHFRVPSSDRDQGATDAGTATFSYVLPSAHISTGFLTMDYQIILNHTTKYN